MLAIGSDKKLKVQPKSLKKNIDHKKFCQDLKEYTMKVKSYTTIFKKHQNLYFLSPHPLKHAQDQDLDSHFHLIKKHLTP